MGEGCEEARRDGSELAAVSAEKPLVIACCSATKRFTPRVTARELPRRSEAFAEHWLEAISAAPPASRADELYSGRAFSMVKAAAAAAAADLAILSAGLGFVKASTPVPAYTFTLASGPDSLRVLSPRIGPAEWWRAIATSPFAAVLPLEVNSRPATLMALTQPYAAMLAETIEALGDGLERVRLLGLGLERVLPASARPSILPYDLRVERLLRGGTRGEFAARATAYHLSEWKGRVWNLDEERQHAAERTAGGELKPVSPRRRATDAEILALAGPQATRSALGATLRRVRRQGVACGSQRLQRLMATEGQGEPTS